MERQIIGKRTPYVSSVDKVTGKAKYTDDLRLQDALCVKILRAPVASARIKAIDVTPALRLPGVKAAITGRDFHRTFGVLPISKDEPPMAKDRVRYVGEPVAAVAAETPEQALAALKAIVVDYEDTPACLDSEKALADTADPIHPELKRANNLHKAVDQAFGDVAAGFAEAAVVVEETFLFPSVTHAFTEPHATQVEVDGRGDITVYSATQVPHYLHLAIAEVLEVPEHRVRVVKPHLGGGFGGKSDPFPHEMICVKLALLTGRSVRHSLEREEVFFSHHGRHPSRITMKLGYHPEKGITALQGKMLIDGGAYGSFGVVTTYYNGVLLQGPYKVPNFAFHCDRVYTNKPMCGAMRGHGGVNPRFCGEVLLDIALRQLSLDPCEARLTMLLESGTLTANSFRVTSNGIRKGLTEIMRRSGWKDKFGKLPFGKGIGVACGFFISGSALPIHWNDMPQSTVRLTVDQDGAVTVYSGASDIGQGSDTMLAQIVAEVLGLPLAMIKVVTADTRLCPIDYGSYSSRVTFMAGNAARNAAIEMRKTLVKAACTLLETPEPAWAAPGEPPSFFRQGQRAPDYGAPYLGPNPDYADGFTLVGEKVVGPDGRGVDYLAVVRRAMDFHGALQSRGAYVSPKMGGNFKGSGAGLSPAYSFSAFITEVTVNPETGFIKVDKVTGAHDCGTVLNPLAVEGQLQGSIHMGLGQALMEQMNYTHGAVQNASMLEYKMLSAFEQPEIDLYCPDSDESEGPFGAKEVGEGALAPVIPSLANAVYDAVGARITRLPITPDKIVAALARKARAGA